MKFKWVEPLLWLILVAAIVAILVGSVYLDKN